MKQDEQLSEHFRLSEFLRSETAARSGIHNDPLPWQFANLRINAACMEAVRGLLGHSIHVLSGLRVEALERVLTVRDFIAWAARRARPADGDAWAEYFATKAHPLGLATDFVCPGFGAPVAICRAIASSDIGFDKLILEHTWVHIAWPSAGEAAARTILTLMPGSNYANGIIEKETA